MDLEQIKMEATNQKICDCIDYVTEEDVKLVLKKYGYTKEKIIKYNFVTENASSKMLGFLSDYWKLKVDVTLSGGQRESLCFFIKAVSRSNAAKAIMVRELNLFQKETFFYSVLKERIELQGLKPWSARFVTALDEAIVFEDLDTLQYRSQNKFKRFDIPHTLQALETLARFHACSIVFEEKKKEVLRRPYVLQEEYEQYLDEGGYQESDTWFQQCMSGALESIKTFSKYGSEEYIDLIETKWSEIWKSALALSRFSTKYRNVICHRDLWNNNILFHYKQVDDLLVPDNCVLVDFQAVRCQPPAGDVMLLLHCNLNPNLREENLNLFLEYYYKELKLILGNFNINIDSIMNKPDFLQSAEEQRLWGLVTCACIMPQFYIDEDLTTEIFTDTEQFSEILSKDKGSFIKKMMKANNDYKIKVLVIFEEIVERYILNDRKQCTYDK